MRLLLIALLLIASLLQAETPGSRRYPPPQKSARLSQSRHWAICRRIPDGHCPAESGAFLDPVSGGRMTLCLLGRVRIRCGGR